MPLDKRLIGEPDDFIALQDLYARHFTRLNRLINLSKLSSDLYVSYSAEGLALYIEVQERHAYTTQLKMTYFIKDNTGCITADPDAQIRVYHDSSQAEATHVYPGSVNEPIFGSLVPVDDVVEYRWKLNRFLDKWLNYLTEHGHNRSTMRPAGANEWPRESTVVQPEWIERHLLRKERESSTTEPD